MNSEEALDGMTHAALNISCFRLPRTQTDLVTGELVSIESHRGHVRCSSNRTWTLDFIVPVDIDLRYWNELRNIAFPDSSYQDPHESILDLQED